MLSRILCSLGLIVMGVVVWSEVLAGPAQEDLTAQDLDQAQSAAAIRLLSIEDAQEIAALYQGLVWLTNSLNAVSDPDEVKSSLALVETQYFLLVSKLRCLRVPPDWCGVDFYSFPDNPIDVKDTVERLSVCVNGIIEEAEWLNKNPIDIPDDTALIAQRVRDSARSLLEDSNQSDWSFDPLVWLKRLAEWLGIYQKQDSESETDWSLFDKVAMVVAVVLLVLVVGFVLRLLLRVLTSKPSQPSRTVPADVVTVARLSSAKSWQEAERAFAQGKMRESLRLFFHAWVEVLAKNLGIEEPEPDETNHEWFVRVADALPLQLRSDTALLVRLFDQHWYGLSEPNRETVARFREQLLRRASRKGSNG